MKELTSKQTKDIERLKHWALKLRKHYDGVTLFKVVNGVDIYMLYKTEWGERHKVGMPVLATIDNDTPLLLNEDEVLGIIVS